MASLQVEQKEVVCQSWSTDINSSFNSDTLCDDAFDGLAYEALPLSSFDRSLDDMLETVPSFLPDQKTYDRMGLLDAQLESSSLMPPSTQDSENQAMLVSLAADNSPLSPVSGFLASPKLPISLSSPGLRPYHVSDDDFALDSPTECVNDLTLASTSPSPIATIAKKRRSPEKQRTCQECQKTFGSYNGWRSHWLKKHERPRQLAASISKQEATLASDDAIQSNHSTDTSESPHLSSSAPPALPAPSSPARSLDECSTAGDANSDKSRTCEECGRVYASQAGWRAHWRKQHDPSRSAARRLESDSPNIEVGESATASIVTTTTDGSQSPAQLSSEGDLSNSPKMDDDNDNDDGV